LKAISFDLDGTLVDLASFDDIFWFTTVPEIYASKNGMDLDQARKEVVGHYSAHPRTPDWYNPHYWFDHFQFDETVEDVLNKRQWIIHVFDDVPEVLVRLGRTHDLLLVTHSSHAFMAHKLIPPLNRVFLHKISVIDEMGCMKERADVYRRIMTPWGYNTREVLHVGDHPIYDYRVPLDAGLRAVYLDRGRKTRSVEVERGGQDDDVPPPEDTINTLDELEGWMENNLG